MEQGLHVNSENIGLQFLASGLSKSGACHMLFTKTTMLVMKTAMLFIKTAKSAKQIYELLGDHQVQVFRYETPIKAICLK